MTIGALFAGPGGGLCVFRRVREQHWHPAAWLGACVAGRLLALLVSAFQSGPPAQSSRAMALASLALVAPVTPLWMCSVRNRGWTLARALRVYDATLLVCAVFWADAPIAARNAGQPCHVTQALPLPYGGAVAFIAISILPLMMRLANAPAHREVEHGLVVSD